MSLTGQRKKQQCLLQLYFEMISMSYTEIFSLRVRPKVVYIVLKYYLKQFPQVTIISK